MTQHKVRPVQSDDVPAVVRLVREVLGEFGLEFGVGSATDDALLALPGAYEDAGGMFWVAEEDGGLLGTCGVYPLDPTTFELRKMYVHPGARGRGLGRALLEGSIAFVRTAGARHLVLDTVDLMAGAIRLYERYGFVRDDGQIRGSRCTRGYRLDL